MGHYKVPLRNKMSKIFLILNLSTSKSLSKKFLLIRPKFQTFQTVLEFLFRESNRNIRFKEEIPRDFGHKMSVVLGITKSSLGVNSGCGFIFGSL